MSNVALKPSQRFTVSHLDEADFKTGGLRGYSAYRDLGIAAATSGLATAHVIRMTAPFSEELSQRHHHNVEFQLVYVLKGWFKSEFEGQGRPNHEGRFLLDSTTKYSAHRSRLVR